MPLHQETKTNAASLVVLVEMAAPSQGIEPVKLLMMGDGEVTVEEQLLREHTGAITNSTLLHVGHHGAEKAATKPFLEVVNPRVAQVSADQNWAHPYRTTIKRITDNPKLRVNEALENDPSHSIVVGQGSGKTKVHEQEFTNSALLMNIGEQVDDVSGSENAKKVIAAGDAPKEAIGQQWRVTFQDDTSFEPFSTRHDGNVTFV
ncbi:MAG: hypothetical protein EOO81_11935 [Oxalobacteraceae bacterium]|nr:MAG: hypothetical protein EOO81_11935 [Oxalobacteraceae bacterium]